MLYMFLFIIWFSQGFWFKIRYINWNLKWHGNMIWINALSLGCMWYIFSSACVLIICYTFPFPLQAARHVTEHLSWHSPPEWTSQRCRMRITAKWSPTCVASPRESRRCSIWQADCSFRWQFHLKDLGGTPLSVSENILDLFAEYYKKWTKQWKMCIKKYFSVKCEVLFGMFNLLIY